MASYPLDHVVHEFYGLSNHAFDVWSAFRALFDDNPGVQCLDKEPLRGFFVRWQEVAITHLLLQIAKLHDPARQAGRENLCVAYMMSRPEWDRAARAELRLAAKALEALAGHLVEARKWTLAHNDLESVMLNRRLGGFPADIDKQYFTDLEVFVGLLQKHAQVRVRPFDRTAGRDVTTFLIRCNLA